MWHIIRTLSPCGSIIPRYCLHLSYVSKCYANAVEGWEVDKNQQQKKISRIFHYCTACKCFWAKIIIEHFIAFSHRYDFALLFLLNCCFYWQKLEFAISSILSSIFSFDEPLNKSICTFKHAFVTRVMKQFDTSCVCIYVWLSSLTVTRKKVNPSILQHIMVEIKWMPKTDLHGFFFFLL